MTPRLHVPSVSRHRRARRTGLSLAEVLVGVGLIILGVALVLPLVSRARAAERKAECLANIRQIAAGFLTYAENQGTFPDPSVTLIPWERSLGQYCPQSVFLCPSDTELSGTGSSYDWRDIRGPDTDPDLNLAGRPLRDVQREGVVLVLEALPGWHGKGTINAAFVDGSARTMSEKECLTDINLPITKFRVRKP